MKRKHMLIAASTVLAGGILLAPATVAFAQNVSDTDPHAIFTEKLAEKLGMDETTIETAVSEVHNEMHTERQAARAEQIAQAVTDGALTQRQADILNAMESSEKPEPKQFGQDKPADFESLSVEERQAQMEAMRTERDQVLVETLRTEGIDTTVEEVQEAHDAAREAGIFAGFGKRGTEGTQGPRGGGMMM